MKKKLSRRAVARLLQFTPNTLGRLHIITTNDMEAPRDYDMWCAEEYTEQDNILFRLLVELKPLLPDTSALFMVLKEIWYDIDSLVESANLSNDHPAGVVIVGDSRYLRWPGRNHWLDLWEPDRQRFDHEIEPSLRITTAIHLQAFLRPIAEAE